MYNTTFVTLKIFALCFFDGHLVFKNCEIKQFMKLEILINRFNYFQNELLRAKAIRGSQGIFQHEIFFPGFTGNSVKHESLKSVNAPLAPVPVTVSIPIQAIKERPAIVDPSIVRSIQNRQNFAAVQPIATTLRPRTTTESDTSEELEEQAKSAYYNFGTELRDTISGNEQTRQEIREGLGLKGMYSYSDGFFRRTVHYEADENGYRVVKEEIEPVGDGEGPKFNPNGEAHVKSTLSGDYAITVDDFRLSQRQKDFIEKNNN